MSEESVEAEQERRHVRVVTDRHVNAQSSGDSATTIHHLKKTDGLHVGQYISLNPCYGGKSFTVSLKLDPRKHTQDKTSPVPPHFHGLLFSCVVLFAGVESVETEWQVKGRSQFGHSSDTTQSAREFHAPRLKRRESMHALTESKQDLRCVEDQIPEQEQNPGNTFTQGPK